MKFKYYKSPNGDMYAYDIDDPTQLPYMQIAIDEGWDDMTGSWPPVDWPPKETTSNG